jgi:hypothetical protein
VNDLIPLSVRNGLERVTQFYEPVDDWTDFIKRFVLYGSGWSPSTYDNILSALRGFFEVWSRTQNREHKMLHPAEITDAHIELWFDWYSKDRRVQSATVKCRCLKAFFKKLSEKFPFFQSPFENMNEQLRKKLSGPARDPRMRNVPTMEEVEKICDYLLSIHDLRHYWMYVSAR